jgi:hypothetical protein
MALTNAEKQARHRARHPAITPEREDVDIVEREYGALPETATLKEQGDRWQLYQVQALIRMAQDNPAIAGLIQKVENTKARCVSRRHRSSRRR